MKKSGLFGDWRLVFAGDGDAGYVDQLKALARQRGLNGDALFAGWLEGDQKYAALKGASLLAMPSYQENFGISLIEAMACGVPVLGESAREFSARNREGRGGLGGGARRK